MLIKLRVVNIAGDHRDRESVFNSIFSFRTKFDLYCKIRTIVKFRDKIRQVEGYVRAKKRNF